MPRVRQIFTTATNSFAKILAIYLGVIGISGILYSYFESRPATTGLWWAYLTGLTIGYGDMNTASLGGQIVTVLIAHAVPLVIIPLIVTRLLTNVIENRDQFTHEEQEQIKADLEKIKKALKIQDDHRERLMGTTLERG